MDRRTEFLAESLDHWKKAISEVVGPIAATSVTWHGLDRIQSVLRPFMGANRNHAHYPTGGGLDFHSVESATESGCLSFLAGDRLADIVKPRAVTLEHFVEAPRESFLLLELDKLASSGADEYPTKEKEGVLEYPSGTYLSRDLWERGYLHHDEDGREVPLPLSSRVVTRWFGGKILIVAKGSLWNSDPATYDGRHNTMTAPQIRAMIKRSAARSI